MPQRRARSTWRRLAHAFILDRPFDPNLNFITSPFFSVPVLGAIRLSLGLYALVTLVVTLAWDGAKFHDANTFFSYFTHLSYIGLCAYLFASGMQCAIYSHCPFNKGTYVLSARWPRVYQFLQVWLYATVSTFPIVVTVVFWSVLSGPNTLGTRFNAWSNVSLHALNTVFALFEIFLTNVPPAPWSYLPLCIILLACYLGVAYITYATQHFYTYNFLNPKAQGPLLAAYIVGIGVGECIIYAIIHYIVFLRQILIRRYSTLKWGEEDVETKEGPREEREELDEWQEVLVPDSASAARVTL
ncbi:hypothetical protein AX15_004630 [Amanita polypyramis BW_CC]|nr:hypothetical protein AX15_004630 [Amanita polypyramis BW_CC]